MTTHRAAGESRPSNRARRRLPEVLRDQVDELEDWAQRNRSEVLWDTFWFWLLKLPAIVLSASAGITAFYKLEGVSVVLSAVASFCVLIDAIKPRGQLRNVHHNAFLKLRRLQNQIVSS